MATVQVTGADPYTIHIGYDTIRDVAGRVKEIGARKAAIVHQGTLQAVARSIAQDLEGEGLTAVLAPIPDAEAGKSLETASALWDLAGEQGLSLIHI